MIKTRSNKSVSVSAAFKKPLMPWSILKGSHNNTYNLFLTANSLSSGSGSQAIQNHILIANSNSSGTMLISRNAFVMAGSSSSSGTMNELYVRNIEAIGESTSSGFSDIGYAKPLSGSSQSSGFDMLGRSYILTGESTTSGTVTISSLGALVDYACYLLNLETKRTYEFTNYKFKGIGRFNGKLIGLRDGKIYDIETTAALDGATAISASMELATDLMTLNKKGFRSLYVDDAEAAITITDMAGNTTAFNITPQDFRGLPRGLVSQAFTIKIENRSGAQITLRRLQGKINVIQEKGV